MQVRATLKTGSAANDELLTVAEYLDCLCDHLVHDCAKEREAKSQLQVRRMRREAEEGAYTHSPWPA